MNSKQTKNFKLLENKLFDVLIKMLSMVFLLYAFVTLIGIVNHVVFEQKNKELMNDFRADAKIIATTYKEDKQMLPSWPVSLQELVNGDTLREEFGTPSDSEYFYHIVEPTAGMAWSDCDYYIELQKNSFLGEGVDTVARIFSDDCSKQWLEDLFPMPFHL